MMELSDEQMHVVVGARSSAWEDVPLPTGRQTLPDWVRGATVSWMCGYNSFPHVSLETNMPYNSFADWPDEVWTVERPGYFMCRHPDGRAQGLSHSGPSHRTVAWRTFAGDRPLVFQWIVPESVDHHEKDIEMHRAMAKLEGEKNAARWADPNRSPALGFTDANNRPYDPTTVHVRYLEVLASEKQAGFGGSHYLLKMDDGSYRLLRGPWSGGTPPGYVQTYNSGGGFISEDLFLRIIATYLPHLRVCRVNNGIGPRLEPYDPNWGMPRGHVFEIERQRHEQKLPAGPHWYVYWGRKGVAGEHYRCDPEFGIDESVRYA